MALIDHIDAVNRDIYLSADTVGATINPIDVYKEMRALRRTDESLRKYLPFLAAKGNDAKGSGKFTERYVVCLNGARVVPYNVSHTLTVVGTIITDDGQEGIACFDRAPLSTTTRVDINYVPPQVEVITVNVAGTGPLTSQEHSQLMAIPTLPWQTLIEGAYTAEQVLKLMAAALAGKVSGAEANTVRFRDLADTTDRITATVDVDGNRTDITYGV